MALQDQMMSEYDQSEEEEEYDDQAPLEIEGMEDEGEMME